MLVFYKNNRSAYEYGLKNNILQDVYGELKRNKRNYWSVEKCLNVAKKCKDKQEFKTEHYDAYVYAVKKNILNTFTFLDKPKTDKYTYEFCLKIASTCKNRVEFSKANGCAYSKSCQKKWIDDFFPESKRIDYEFAKTVALSYNNDLTKFRKEQQSLYNYLVRHKKIHIFFKKENKWTFEKVKKVAMNYTSKKEFNLNKPFLYELSRKNKWLKLFDWFETPLLGERKNNTKNYIYAYLDEENKTCYIGRTINLQHRHIEHNNKRYIKNKKHEKKYYYDTVKIYFSSINKPLPKPIILEITQTYNESQIKEKEWIDKYKENGWFILNRAKTGLNISSLGGNYEKWTYDVCKTEAQKYISKKEFRKNALAIYTKCMKKKWIDEFSWLK